MAICAVEHSLSIYQDKEYQEERYQQYEAYMLETDMQERRSDVINLFYNNGLSFAVAKAAARLWAQAWIDTNSDDDACLIAQRLDLEMIDAFAVIEDRDSFAVEYNELHKNDYQY